ncbi:MAG: sigma-54-dependent Fis family transcriptional regulator [Myxococcales bacterium]|nr:sigma-54-dependent Fis family transcriptional regulator [Myxococcales bacterium]
MARPRFVQTTLERAGAPLPSPNEEPVLVLAWHAQLARVGERLDLDARLTEVSRLAPSWRTADGAEAGPLDDPFVSRTPFELWRLPSGMMEVGNPGGVALEVGGAPLAAGARRKLSALELRRGVPLGLGDRVVLMLTTSARFEEQDHGLVGVSAAMSELRAQVRAAADQAGPVLIQGETGTGKDLVARALHALGPRARGPLVAVNVAAIPAATAAAELFGHERGAFTGAEQARPGYFARAAGGTLFLDEVGDLPESVQPMLLRALESGEVQPVGGQPRAVAVSVVAATDLELEAAITDGRFRGPLYYRLAGTVVRVPPLRERGVDVALLLARFMLPLLPAALADQTTAPQLGLPARAVVELLRRPWPGNVRELRSAAGQLAEVLRTGKPLRAESLAALGAASAGAKVGGRAARASAPEVTPEVAPAPPRAFDEARLLATLRDHGFSLARTASALGVSRTHLDALIARSKGLRKAKDLAREEIVACRVEVGDDLTAMAARLAVSPRGLRLRMRQLGM